MKSNESAEMYLESILMLSERGTPVRSIDIVRMTGYSKPSISRAMGLLKQKQYIEIDEAGIITLLPEGLAIASKVLERHRLLTSLLGELGVSEETAGKDACKIEHVISDETFEKIKEHFGNK